MSRLYCRGCHQRIRWAHNPAGRPVSLNPTPDPGGALAYVYTPHGWRVRAFTPGQIAALGITQRWSAHAPTCPALREAGR